MPIQVMTPFAFIGVLVKLSFSAAPNFTRELALGGRIWREYWITQNCGMTVTGRPNIACAVWMCGGGGGGAYARSSNANPNGGGGGGGGFYALYEGPLSDGLITIGQGGAQTGTADATNGGASSLAMTALNETITANGGYAGTSTFSGTGYPSNGGNGGSGGGASGTTGIPGTGQGGNAYPFGDMTNFANPWCAGGGAGGSLNSQTFLFRTGGAGGTNGGSGGAMQDGATSNDVMGGLGGIEGGGNGGSARAGVTTILTGGYGTMYGAGGGGGSRRYIPPTQAVGNGGAGFQGIVIIRIPIS